MKKMNALLVTASALAVSLTAASAQAQPSWPYWYVGLGGGVTFLDDSDISGVSTGEASFDTGGVGTVSLGYMPPFDMAFGGLRFELEFGYHHNSFDAVTIGGTTSGDGSARGFSYMGNIYYDMRNSSQFTPYLGAGLGAASLKVSPGSGISTTDEYDHVLAYQFMAGVSYAPQSLPQTEWSMGYRYFAAQSPEYRSASGRIELDDVTAHTAEVGARFRF